MLMETNRSYGIRILCSVLFLTYSLCLGKHTHALMVNPENVKEIAIYGQTSGFGEGLELNQLIFNITDTALITSMISSIEFSAERDCSTSMAITSAYVYVKFSDDSVEVYDLFGLWGHLSKVGLRGSCYFISEQGQALFESNTQ